MKFKIGDRVRCTDGIWNNEVEGIIGTIVTVRYGSSYGIRFDEKVRNELGHTLNGFLGDEYRGYGYWIDEEDLEIYKKSNIGGY